MEAVQLGARGFVRKPFTVEQIKEKLATLFSKRRVFDRNARAIPRDILRIKDNQAKIVGAICSATEEVFSTMLDLKLRSGIHTGNRASPLR